MLIPTYYENPEPESNLNMPILEDSETEPMYTSLTKVSEVDSIGYSDSDFDSSINESPVSDEYTNFLDGLFGKSIICYNPSEVQQKLYGVSEDKFICEERSVDGKKGNMLILTCKIYFNGINTLV